MPDQGLWNWKQMSEILARLEQIHKITNKKDKFEAYRSSTSIFSIDTHCKNLEFLQMWLEFLELALNEGYEEDEIRNYYKYLYNGKVCVREPFLFCHWAKFEIGFGKKQKALKFCL